MKRLLTSCRLAMALCSTALLLSCLPEDKDPGREALTTDAVSGQYASALGNIAVRAQDIILKDSSWFTNVSGATLDLAAYGVSQPHGPAATIRAGVCPMSSTGRLRQITWLDANDGAGKFSVSRLGNSSGAILTALRKTMGGDQIGTYRGNNAIEMGDGNILSIPATCHSLSLPLDAPVVVFSIDRPASPAVAVSKKEYRAVACPPDASGRPQRGTLVQTRLVTFSSSGFSPSPSSDTGWQTDDMGQCIEDVSIYIASHDNVADGATGDLSAFANSAMRNLLAAQLKMDCSRTVVAGTKRDGKERVSTGYTVDTCANAAAGSEVALNAKEVGTNEGSRELVCSGSFDNPSAQLGNIALSGGRVTWEPRPGFSNKATLVQSRTAYDLNTREDNQSSRGKWVAGDIDCAGTETATLACAEIPGAPATTPAPPMSGNAVTIKDFTIPASEKPYPMNDEWSVHVVDKNYFTRARSIENGGLTLTRDVSATSWENAAAFKPKVTGEAWTITENQCSWNMIDMRPDCPTEFDAAKQGDWWPTGQVLDLGWTSEGNNAIASAYWYDERAPEPAELSADAFSYLMVRPWTADAPISDAQAKKSASAWVFRYLRGKGEMPVAVVGYPDRTAPEFQGYYLKSWKTSAPNNIAFKDGTWVHDGKQYVYGFTLTTQPRDTAIQTTLLNQNGVITRYKATVNGSSVGIGATEYVNPLYCGRSEEREFTVPFKHFACGGALIKEKAVTITYTSYRRWRGTAPGVGSWSKPVGRFSTSDSQLLASPYFSLFDRPVMADSAYLTASGDPIFPKEGLSYTDECAPEEPFCPALTTPSCAANEIVVNIPIFRPGGLQLGNCTQNVCAPVSTPPVVTPTPVQCPAVTQPTCTGFTHFVASPNDANGCTTVGKCERNACPALGNTPQNQSDCDRQEWAGGPAFSFVNGGTDANGCPRANSCHQETFNECVSRTGGYVHAFDWYGSMITGLPDYGCCGVYYPGGQGLNAGDACAGWYPGMFGAPQSYN